MIELVTASIWISFTSSVKQNTLFIQAKNKSCYDKVIRVCQIKSDIDFVSLLRLWERKRNKFERRPACQNQPSANDL